jgi:hypothetical protein
MGGFSQRAGGIREETQRGADVSEMRFLRRVDGVRLSGKQGIEVIRRDKRKLD